MSITGGTFSLGGKSLSCVDFSQTGGTFNGNTGTITASGNVAVTGGTHNYNTYNLTMTGNGTTIQFDGPLALQPEHPRPGRHREHQPSSPLTVAGNLSVDDWRRYGRHLQPERTAPHRDGKPLRRGQ